ncbi:MAG TPA: DUF4169 family protein [Bradyrhizobium sp.]|jgi:uncharacterized protein DUF4169|nr:DUF4169 family protein [Bradyrhizobium sp.]
MGFLINLRQTKKRIGREQSEKQAAANRARFGRTRAERALQERRISRANELLDQHHVNGEDAS